MKQEKFPRFLSLAAVATVAAALVCWLSGCTPTLNCGTWAFNVTVQSNPDAFPLSSAFTFTPATCGQSCSVDSDAMIQITWVYDTVSRTNIYASGVGDEARHDANGWNIDRVDGEAYGWYGLTNDGSTFYSGWNTPGANNTANTLFDRPGGWPNNTWFYAVDAAVCFRSSTCQNKILGYYFWSWTIDNNGNAAQFITAPAWENLNVEFQSALASWNTWAPTSGTEAGVGFPGEPSVTHAVVFPAMSDL
jgi:hypothetical protein